MDVTLNFLKCFYLVFENFIRCILIIFIPLPYLPSSFIFKKPLKGKNKFHAPWLDRHHYDGQVHGVEMGEGEAE